MMSILSRRNVTHTRTNTLWATVQVYLPQSALWLWERQVNTFTLLYKQAGPAVPLTLFSGEEYSEYWHFYFNYWMRECNSLRNAWMLWLIWSEINILRYKLYIASKKTFCFYARRLKDPSYIDIFDINTNLSAAHKWRNVWQCLTLVDKVR